MATKSPTIAQIVAEHITELKALTIHTELKEWAEAHELMTQARFPRFKKALLEHGIDYAAMRSEAAEARRNAATHEITLFSDAKASKFRFGICDQDGQPVWHGRDFDEIGEQSAAELAAAKKAVWLAGRVRERRGLDSLKLNLRVDAEWLTHANRETGGGQAAQLWSAATKAGVVLSVQWIPGVQNPADEYTICTGYQKWQSGIDQITVTEIPAEAEEVAR